MTEKKTNSKKAKKTEKEIKVDVKGRGRKPQNKIFNFKTLIMTAGCFIALVIVVIAIVLVGTNAKIESSFFKTDDSKIVITLNKEMAALDETEYEPYITHVVYFRNGDNITEARAYYEYESEEEAAKIFPKITVGEFAESKFLNGRFIVFQIKPIQYEDVTATEIEENLELLKGIDAIIEDYNENTIKEYGPIMLEPYFGDGSEEVENNLEETENSENDSNE